MYKYATSDGRCRCETEGVRLHLMMYLIDRFILFFCHSLNELAVLSVDCGFGLFHPQHSCFSLAKTRLSYYTHTRSTQKVPLILSIGT